MDIEKYFTKALECQKEDQPDLAITLYQEILEADPKHLPSLYNLANIHGDKGEYETAQEYYDELLRIEPDYVRAYYNLAICHLQQKNIERAQQLLEQALHLVPEYSAAHHMLGSILFKQNKWKKAKKHFEAALVEDEAQGEVHCHLGMTHLHQGDLKKAETSLQRALKLMPYLAEAQYHMGVIRLKQGTYSEAETYFQEAIDRDPKHFGALYNLGLLKKQQGFLKLADEFLRQAEELDPDNEDVKFVRASLNKDTLTEQPPSHFVENLFDRYAQYYDKQMKEGVHYHVPERLHEYFKTHVNAARDSLTLVDLGCGTGLTGEQFKPYAKQMIGIDVSNEMLEKARAKNLYDDLWHADILEAMNKLTDESIDVFLAGDVLGYMGNLEQLFDLVSSKLKHDGYWLFSIEVGEQDHELSEHIRFTHSEDYIQFLSQVHGLKVLFNGHESLRRHHDKDFFGAYFIVQKA